MFYRWRIFHHLYRYCSRFGFVYLIKEKFDTLTISKIFKAEIEKQLDKRTKVYRSDRMANIMKDTLNRAVAPVHLQDSLNKKASCLYTQCLECLYRMVLLREEIGSWWILLGVWSVIQPYPSLCSVKHWRWPYTFWNMYLPKQFPKLLSSCGLAENLA